MKSWASAAAAVIALIATVGSASAALPIKRASFVEKHPSYEVDFQYPRTGNRTIDTAIEIWARDFAKGFAESAVRDHETDNLRPYTAHLRYDIARNESNVFAVAFRYAYDLGGAHPNSATFTFDFLMPDAWRIYLPEIVKPDAWQRVSDLAVADLIGRVASGPDALSTEEWVRRGAGPASYNFSEFVLLKDELLIYFDPYQVAAYAAGRQAAHTSHEVARRHAPELAGAAAFVRLRASENSDRARAL